MLLLLLIDPDLDPHRNPNLNPDPEPEPDPNQVTTSFWMRSNQMTTVSLVDPPPSHVCEFQSDETLLLRLMLLLMMLLLLK